MSESTPDEAPGLGLFVTSEQRERAQGVLAEAYADGRLTGAEFDQRLDQVLLARTRRDLNTAFYGLIEAPTPAQALGLRPPTEAPDLRTRAIAALTHLSALPTWVVGPGVAYFLSEKGSYVRQQAGRAVVFQVGALLGLIAAVTIAGLPEVKIWWTDGLGPQGREQLVAALYGMVWAVLTTAGAANAALGDLWRNRPMGRKSGEELNPRALTEPVV